MNTSLSLQNTQNQPRKNTSTQPEHKTQATVARPDFLAFIEAMFALILTTADDPAAFRYAAGKYDGELD